MEIILKGNPISTNNCYYHAGKGLTFIRPKAKLLKNSYIKQAKEQWGGKLVRSEVSVTIKLFFGDKRKRDFDNYHKLSIDSLKGVVWEDDSLVKEAHIYCYYDKENPRIEIAVKELSTQ